MLGSGMPEGGFCQFLHIFVEVILEGATAFALAVFVVHNLNHARLIDSGMRPSATCAAWFSDVRLFSAAGLVTQARGCLPPQAVCVTLGSNISAALPNTPATMSYMLLPLVILGELRFRVQS